MPFLCGIPRDHPMREIQRKSQSRPADGEIQQQGESYNCTAFGYVRPFVWEGEQMTSCDLVVDKAVYEKDPEDAATIEALLRENEKLKARIKTLENRLSVHETLPVA